MMRLFIRKFSERAYERGKVKRIEKVKLIHFQKIISTIEELKKESLLGGGQHRINSQHEKVYPFSFLITHLIGKTYCS